MDGFKAQFFTGDYRERQLAANAAGVLCYFEQHFNATDRTGHDDYACAIVAFDATEKTRAWAKSYLARVTAATGLRDGGVIIGPSRGGGNVRHVHAPAILAEPIFISSKRWAEWIRLDASKDVLAFALVDSVFEHFSPGLVGLSVGHAGKTSQPHDRGAISALGDTEADLAADVLRRAAVMLEAPK